MSFDFYNLFKNKKTPVLSGPDIFVFPDIDNCYAVRRAPKRWNGAYSNTLYLYSNAGWVMGEYTENGWHADTNNGSGTISIVKDVDMKSDLSLENAIRYCYLMAQNEKEFQYVREPSIRHKEIQLFAYVMHNGYGIFNEKCEMVGSIQMSENAKYYPSGVTDVRAIPRLSGKFLKSSSIDGIEFLLPEAFEFISKKETLYKPGGAGVEGFEIVGALRAKYHVNFRRIHGE